MQHCVCVTGRGKGGAQWNYSNVKDGWLLAGWRGRKLVTISQFKCKYNPSHPQNRGIGIDLKWTLICISSDAGTTLTDISQITVEHACLPSLSRSWRWGGAGSRACPGPRTRCYGRPGPAGDGDQAATAAADHWPSGCGHWRGSGGHWGRPGSRWCHWRRWPRGIAAPRRWDGSSCCCTGQRCWSCPCRTAWREPSEDRTWK